jgi:hypothetical protein
MEHSVNPSHDLDLVTVFRLPEGGITETEMETVQHLLESNGIATVVVGDSPLPNLAGEIQVARDHAARAKEIIAEALSIGSAGAEEAESQTENG